MCSWPLDSPLHCRVCASHPDIALERVARRRRAAITQQQQQQRRNCSARSKSCCESPQQMNLPTMANADASEKCTTAIVAVCPATDDNSAATAESVNFCNQYKSRKTKSYAFLLIFICAIFVRCSYAIPITSSGQRLILHTSQYRQRYHQQLLQQQRAQVQPTPHHHHLHHRSVSDSSSSSSSSTMSKPHPDNYSDIDCQLVVRALNKTRTQANSTFKTMRGWFNEFTRLQYQNQEPIAMRKTWKMHNLHLKHPLAERVLSDIDVMPGHEHFNHLLPITKATLSTELQKVYITLKTLNKTFDEVINDRRRNEDVILHDLNNTRDNLNNINEFFDNSLRHLNFDLLEAEDAMKYLDIPFPEVDDVVDYDRNIPSIRDFLLANEHLSVMQYLIGLYTFFLEQCPATAAAQ